MSELAPEQRQVEMPECLTKESKYKKTSAQKGRQPKLPAYQGFFHANNGIKHSIF